MPSLSGEGYLAALSVFRRNSPTSSLTCSGPSELGPNLRCIEHMSSDSLNHVSKAVQASFAALLWTLKQTLKKKREELGKDCVLIPWSLGEFTPKSTPTETTEQEVPFRPHLRVAARLLSLAPVGRPRL